jgi:rhamnogalacturonyl hydrolase YesR
MRPIIATTALVALFGAAPPLVAQEDANARVDEALQGVDWPDMVRLPIGVTRRGTVIWCLMDAAALDYRSSKPRVLYVGGLDGSPRAAKALTAFASGRAMTEDADTQALGVIPIPHPDAWAERASNDPNPDAVQALRFPAVGRAYAGGEDESAYLWRFIGWFAPDAVYELIHEDDPLWKAVRAAGRQQPPWPKDCLAAACRTEPVATMGTVLATRWPLDGAALLAGPAAVVRYARVADTPLDPNVAPRDRPPVPWSQARRQVIGRLDRAPLEVARQLTDHYGLDLKVTMYQPALALVARLRYGALSGDSSHHTDVTQLVAPYASGQKPTMDAKSGGSHLAGHLIFAELANGTGDPRYVELVKRAADYAFDEDGRPREAMPFHSEMSDAVFMSCPILTAAGRLTREQKYFDMALRHLRFMHKLCVRDDGLYRHSPLCEAAWGRGNGFPALGLALSLTDIDATASGGRTPAGNARNRDPDSIQGTDAPRSPELSAIRDELLAAFRAHMAALAKHQDPTGTWHQVIDFPGSYRELTATCMITFAMARGIRHGWLDAETYRPIVEKAWEGIKVRVGADGTLFDVCTGTGKQQTLRDYLDREAILGKDERGGAMALIVSVEMAEWMAER